MRYVHPDDDTHLATEGEADREYAHNVGRDHPEKAWILSDRDVWYANPFYRGPKVEHPEFEPPDTDGDTRQWNENGESQERENDRYASRTFNDPDIPF